MSFPGSDLKGDTPFLCQEKVLLGNDPGVGENICIRLNSCPVCARRNGLYQCLSMNNHYFCAEAPCLFHKIMYSLRRCMGNLSSGYNLNINKALDFLNCIYNPRNYLVNI